jgi:hypothetical protein
VIRKARLPVSRPRAGNRPRPEGKEPPKVNLQ